MQDIELIRPSGAHRSRDREVIKDVAGNPVADLGLAPALMVNLAIQELRRSPDQPAADRFAAMAKAGALFGRSELEGETPEAYCSAIAKVGGLPIQTVRLGLTAIAELLEDIEAVVGAQRPAGLATSWREQRAVGGSGVWVPRGKVFGVHAPGNHPMPHAEWLIALALGYRVAVRPSRRDPYTPRRLMRALVAAGVSPGYMAMLPCSHEVADTVIRRSDLAIVYGDDHVVRRYENDRGVLVRGPGRSKVAIGADADWRQHLDVLVDSVAAHGGVGCINTTSIFVDGDARALGEELAERLDKLPARPAGDSEGALPVYPLEQAEALVEFATRRAGDAVALHRGPLLVDLGDGSAALRPAVFLLTDARQPQATAELPFPCVWVAPWRRAGDEALLQGSLALTLMGVDDDLMDTCVGDPSIRNVYRGSYPTCWQRVELPHDGFLGDFLMDAKAVAR